MVTIIDYDVGNVGSIVNMLGKVGVECRVSSAPEAIAESDRIILPGVGSFDEGVRNLEKRDLKRALSAFALERKKPVLGICLGMQLLAQSSEEGSLSGLGLLPLKVKAFEKAEAYEAQIPAMGWNYVTPSQRNDLLEDRDSRFYFVHSYYFEQNSYEIISTTVGDFTYCAGFARDNIFGVQFHPEKSHRFGLSLLRNFCAL